MARKTKEEKRIEAEVNAGFRKASSVCGPIDMFDIGKVMSAGEQAGKNGQNIEEAVLEAYKKCAVGTRA